MPADIYHLLSVLRLEAGLDSSLNHADTGQTPAVGQDDDDWDDDDYDVEVVYVRD